MNLKLGGYELEAGRSGSGLGSYYSKLEMSALLLCAVLKNSYFRHCSCQLPDIMAILLPLCQLSAICMCLKFAL